MARTRWQAFGAWIRDRRGVSQYVALAIAAPVLLMAYVGGSALVETVSTQAALHNAAEMVDRSLVADGCLTQDALDAVTQTLEANHVNPNQVYLNTTGGSGGPALYGARGLAVTLGYDLNLALPGTPWTLAHDYVQTQVTNDQSQYVPQAVPNAAACVDATTLASTFAGVQGGQGSGGALSSAAPAAQAPTGITEQVSPNPATVGQTVTVSGQVQSGSGPAAGVGVTVSAAGQQVTATTDSQGDYTATLTFTTAGQVTVTATAGSVSQRATLTVQPATPASVRWSAPSSVVVGQAFTLQGTVLAADGQPVADGTAVAITSNDPHDIPDQTVTTTAGQFSVSVPTGITTLAIEPITVTAQAGSASATASIQVQPGAPQAVTLEVSPAQGPAGSAWTVSGTVTGPDGTPVAAGTAVTLASANDAQDTLPTLETNAQGQFSGSVTLTLAGSVTLTAQAGSVASAPVTVTVLPGAPAQLVDGTATPNPVNQGAQTVIGGVVEDAWGNPVAPGTALTLVSSTWSQPVVTTTGAQGQVSQPVVFDQAGSQVVTVEAGGTPLQNGTVSVRVSQQGAYTITATQATTTLTAGQTTTVTFTLTNSQGQPVAGQTLDFSAQPRAGTTLSATQGTTDAQGQVALSVSATQAGTLTVTAALAADNGTTTGTATWTVTAAAPATVDPPTIAPSTAVSTQDGGTVYPTISGVALDAYGNPLVGATVTVTGGWDPGVSFTGTTNAQGYFAISLDPVVVGGPYHPTVTVTDAQGSTTTTDTDTSLTVTTNTSILPPGTPMDYTVTLTGQVGNYNTGYPWYSPANVSLTATVNPTVSGTVWDIGIYDETQGQWVGECTTGTTCTVTTYSTFTSQGQSDTYVAAVGIMKYSALNSQSLLTWAQSVIIAESAPLTLTLPTLQYAYTGLYPNVWGGYGAPPFTGWPIALDSWASIQFSNAVESSNPGSDPIRILSIQQGTQSLNPVYLYGSYAWWWFYLVDTWDPITVQYVYTFPGAPPPQGQSAWTTQLTPPSTIPWSVGGCTNGQYGLICYANTYSTALTWLQITLDYGGQAYSTTLVQQASTFTGYDFQAYFGGWFGYYPWGSLDTPGPTTVTGTAWLYQNYPGPPGPAAELACSFTVNGNQITSGGCNQVAAFHP